MEKVTPAFIFSSSMGLPQRLSGKEFTCNAGDGVDTGSIPGWGRTPGGGHGNPLQYSCLENARARGAWWAVVYGVAQSQTRLKRLSSSSSRSSHFCRSLVG